MSGGVLILRNVMLSYADTTEFRVIVKRTGRDDRIIKYTGRVLGSIYNIIGKVPVSSGVKRIPIDAGSQYTRVIIENDSVFDAVFQTADIEATYTKRARLM